MIQLLPLNDSGCDSSPYNALSAHALNPIFLGLASLPYLNGELKKAIKTLQRPPEEPKINYREVRERKDAFLRHYYDAAGSKVVNESAYQEFVQNCSSWLPAYAAFKALKQKYGWTSWQSWPKFSEWDEKEAQYQQFLQYLCFRQMSAVKQHAETYKIWIKGDIPILISPDSADVWHQPEIFDLTLCAGAPPDQYSQEGQKWGFPLYNWDVLEKQNYQWWKDRLQTAEMLYRLYRIDHIVGFFRIWGIPINAPAKEGHFVPADQSLWIPEGRKFLEMLLSCSSLLPIGEDSGTVPPEVRLCMRALGICGTKVIRWERKWNEDKRFTPFDEYEPLSMTTVSTHDSESLRQWWRNSPDEAQAFCVFKGWSSLLS